MNNVAQKLLQLNHRHCTRHIFTTVTQSSTSSINKLKSTSLPVPVANSIFVHYKQFHMESLPIWPNRIASFSPHTRLVDKLVALQIKKRPVRKKRVDEQDANGNFSVAAYATADEYDLERLKRSLIEQNLYEPTQLSTQIDDTTMPAEDIDVLYVTAKYHVSNEPREMFFFREGSVVLWNCSELECSNVLQHLHRFENDSYDRDLVYEESEIMSYNYDDERAQLKKDTFLLTRPQQDQQQQHSMTALEKYAFSNAMTASVKLGVWEAALDKYVDSMAYVTEDLKRGRPIKMSRSEVLRKTGELFALRHLINLSSDLLDTPDFYWDREQLENLYSNTCTYFSIQRRTKVMNEKLNHCIELADLISSNLNDKHHIRLEWMIIVLIMVEVAFEAIHYVERYLGNHGDGNGSSTSTTIQESD